MKLGLLILKEEELLDTLLKKCTASNIKNITIVNSTSLATEHSTKHKRKDVNIFGSIRYLLDYYNDESRIILIPIKEARIDELKKLIADLVPIHQYQLFIIPIETVEGTLES